MGAPRFVRLLSITAVALFASAVVVENAFAQWTYRFTPGPLVRNITVYANNPVAGTHTLFASTLTNGMYKGIDNGTSVTWQTINTGIPIGQVRAHVAVSTTLTTDFYAVTDGAGIFKTTDGGATWTAINGNGATALGCLDVRTASIIVATQPRTLLVSTSCRNGSGVYRSVDDGANWTRLGPAPGLTGSLPGDVQSSGLNRTTPTPPTQPTYYLATSNYGVFKSTDGGATWSAANNGITGTNAFNVTFSGATGTAELLVYVHGSGVYRSTDSGANWALSEAGLPTGYAALGGINRETGLIQYIGLDKQGIYRTTNGGLNWSPWGSTATDSDAKYARGISSPVTGIAGLYYLSTIEGVVKTTNDGTTLQLAGDMNGGRVNAISHDRDTPSIAYLALKFPLKVSNIYGDYNSPALFTLLDNGVTGATNDGVVYQDRLTPANLYITTNNRGIFKSTSGGTSFVAINNGLPNMIGKSSRLAIDPTNSQNLFLGLSDEGGVYKSTNGGTSWVLSSTGLSTTPKAMNINIVTVDLNNPSIVWAATSDGVFKSTNSGANWTQKYSAVDGAGSPLGSNVVRVRPGNSNEIYIANYHVNANGTLVASSGLQRSIDGGTTWNNILPGHKMSQVRVTAGGDIYAGVSAQIGNPAVYLSTNGGTSFVPYSANLLGSDIRSFGIGADDSVLISLSLENGFYTNDAGQTPILRVTKIGAGTVTSSPVGINCGDTCAASVAAGSVLTLTATPSAGSTFSGWSGGGCTGTGTCVVTVNLATTVVATFTGGSFSLLSVKSRKTHGPLGAFDLSIDPAIATSGLVAVESRAIGAGHKIVFQFSGPVTSVGGVTSKDAAGLNDVGSAAFAISGNDVVVTLTGVPDNRRAKISLTDINSPGTNASASIGFLVGDVNNTRTVSAADTSVVKARSAQTTTVLNFKFDVNATGVISAADIAAVKARPGTLAP